MWAGPRIPGVKPDFTVSSLFSRIPCCWPNWEFQVWNLCLMPVDYDQRARCKTSPSELENPLSCIFFRIPINVGPRNPHSTNGVVCERLLYSIDQAFGAGYTEGCNVNVVVRIPDTSYQKFNDCSQKSLASLTGKRFVVTCRTKMGHFGLAMTFPSTGAKPPRFRSIR